MHSTKSAWDFVLVLLTINYAAVTPAVTIVQTVTYTALAAGAEDTASGDADAPTPYTSNMSLTGAVTNATTSTGQCESPANPCVGDVTHYDGGPGACGTVVDTNHDMVIALPHELMGTQSNDNRFCGRSLTLRNPSSGRKAVAKVADKCMGCVGYSIDLTNIAFQTVVPDGDGRVHGIEWWFNE